MRLSRVALVVLGALAGASAWISFGSLALTDAAARTRVGALPPLWGLATLVAVGAALPIVCRMSLAHVWPLALSLVLWLPWLPMRVPAAFLLWDGPLEAVVWSVIVLAIVVAALRTRTPGPMSWVRDPATAPWLSVALALTCWLAGAAAIDERIPAGDEPHYLIITQSLIADGDLRIENNHQQGDYLAYYPSDLRRPDFMRRGTDGQIYSVHLPGISVLVLPAFVVAGYWGAVVFVALVAAMGGALAWQAAWRLTGSASAAWIGWTAVAFSPPVFFSAFTIYPDTVGATLAMFVVWWLARVELGDPVVRPAWLVAVGAALAALPWLHTRFAIVAAGLGLAVLLRVLARPERVRLAATFLAIPVVGAAAWFGYFWAIYGAPDPSLPYNGLGQNRLATLQPGIPGLLFDQQFGLIANAPAFAAAAFGAATLARRVPRLILEVGLVAAAYFLAVASYGMWWAGLSAPARFLLVLLWPAALPVAWLWHSARSIATRAAIVTALVVGTALLLGRVLVDGGGLLYNGRDGYDLLLDWASRTVNLPLAFPSLHRDAPGTALGDIAVWAVCAGLGYAALAWLLRNRHLAPGLVGTAAGAVALAGVMLGATIVWARHGQHVLTPPTSELAFLQHWDPARQPTALKLRPTRRLDASRLPEQLELTTPSRGAQGSGEQPLLRLPLVPAGRYLIAANNGTRTAGALVARIGRTPVVFETWEPGARGAELELPVQVHSVTIDGDESARSLMTSLVLRPLSVVPPADRLSPTYARRAAVYGSARVFFLDDDAFMEQPGFWTRGEADTALIVEPRDARAVELRLRNGAVANVLTVVSGEWRADVNLAPEEARTIALPEQSMPAARLVTLTTREGFRPAERDPASGDFRKLGVWVEVP